MLANSDRREITAREIVPDEASEITARLLRWCDDGLADLVITTGGTGISARDITPEATAGVIQKPLPGIAEALRMTAWPRVPGAILSRGLAGTRGKALIVNLPGSTGGVKDGLEVLAKIVDHAVDLLRGKTEH